MRLVFATTMIRPRDHPDQLLLNWPWRPRFHTAARGRDELGILSVL